MVSVYQTYCCLEFIILNSASISSVNVKGMYVPCNTPTSYDHTIILHTTPIISHHWHDTMISLLAMNQSEIANLFNPLSVHALPFKHEIIWC
jgi:hypothetical protein